MLFKNSVKKKEEKSGWRRMPFLVIELDKRIIATIMSSFLYTVLMFGYSEKRFKFLAGSETME